MSLGGALTLTVAADFVQVLPSSLAGIVALVIGLIASLRDIHLFLQIIVLWSLL
jgi:hypothetical protein